jgi:hypothetical protein
MTPDFRRSFTNVSFSHRRICKRRQNSESTVF